MKKLIFLIVILALAAANAFAARIYPAEGRVVDEQGQAVEYATVVLLKGSDQVAGMATDDTGRFVLKVPSGEYTLSVQYLGFDPVVRQVRVEENNDLGEIVMKSSTTRIEGVVVKAQLIRREADRFVVDVANAPAAIGKDGIELLERAPGVWIDDEKISINGKSGSKVYVNDRELRMEPEQLLTYLRSLRAGAKYTYNDMHNDALYEYVKDGAWVRNDNQSFTINYTENIAAAYGIASANLGRWSLVAGLRGEYTHTRGKGGDISQNYFSLFPNANVSYALTKDGAYSLIAQYARTIERPRFWSLNPQRFQISDYTYQTGNPELDPAYKQDISLTLVLKHKYTLPGGMTIQRDEIQQTIRPDADDPARLCLAWTNFDTTKNYYLTANAPFQFTKWWTMNLNLTYIRQGQRIDEHSAEKHYNFYFVNSSTTFSLPAKFYIDLSYRFQSRMDFGNCWVKPLHFLNAGIKKRFGDKFTASFSVRNLIERPQHIGARGDGFVRMVDVKQQWNDRSFTIGVTYNFKSGKAFKRKAVEAGSADEKNRL